MNQTRAQLKLTKNSESQPGRTDEFSSEESGGMASKFAAEHNLASAHEDWAELNRWDLYPKQVGEIPASLDEPN